MSDEPRYVVLPYVERDGYEIRPPAIRLVDYWDFEESGDAGRDCPERGEV